MFSLNPLCHCREGVFCGCVGVWEGRLVWQCDRGAHSAGCQRLWESAATREGREGATVSVAAAGAICVCVGAGKGTSFCLGGALGHLMLLGIV